MQQPRRRFLRWLGGSSLAGVVGIPAVAAAEEPVPMTDHALPIAETWDMSWVDRLTGKYRAVFDSPDVSDGAALVRAVAWCDMYKEVYGSERSEMSPVVVLRHSAIPLVMRNEYWERFEIGKELKIKNSKGKWTTTNPVSRGEAAATDRAARYTVETFLENGGVVLACNWAFGMVVGNVRKREKLEAAAARARALEMMLPGIVLQPNGIFAALRAQEAGCRYVMAS